MAATPSARVSGNGALRPRPWRLLLAWLLVLAVLAGCQAPAGGAERGGQALRVALSSDVVTLDPHLLTDTSSGFVSSQIHEPLFAVDFDQRIIPWLAEKLELPDPRTYVITLRQGVKFSNGDELTADDVKFSFDRLMNPATNSPRAWRLTDAIASSEDIKVVDRYTVQLTLKQPFAPFLERLTQPSGFILSRKAVEAAGGDYAHQPVGTGPFKLVEWKPGEQVALERNPGYWGERTKVERLVFRPIPDTQTRLAELESGGVDHIVNVPSEEIRRLREEGRVQVLTDDAISVFYLGYNTRKAPLSSLSLRQAMNFSIDREEIVSRLFDGIGRVAVGPLDPSSWAFDPTVQRYAYDPVRGKELLQAAGGPPAEPIELVFNQTPEMTQVAERIQAQLKDNLGLRVTLKPMEWGAFLSYIKGGDEHQMYLLSWTGTADPDGTLFPLFHSKNFGAAGNRMFYKNERVDELLSAAQRTVDQDARRQMYVEAQELIAGDAPWLPLRHGVVSAAMRSNEHGFRLHPLNNQVFTSVTID